MRFHDYHRWRMMEWLREHRRHHRHHPHHHPFHAVLFVNGVGTVLNAGQENKIMITLTKDHRLECVLTVLDQNGNPMLTPVAFDAPPAWSNTTPATETILASADGLTCEGTEVALGTDVVNVSAVLKGVTLQTSVVVEFDDVPQVPTSIRIDASASV